VLYYNLIDFREGNIMRKLTPEERAAKNAGLAQVAEVVAEPKKKAKKAKDEPQGIGSDSFVMPTTESVQEEAPAVVVEEVVEEISISDSDAAAK
jgi:hypothetical protein